jgi:hypothetical protein
LNHIRLRQLLAVLGASALLLMSASSAMAHVIEHAGSYSIALGWKTEPTYVDEQNAVQAIVTDGSGKPVIDLGPDDLKVVVSTGGQQSGELTFDNGFDADTGLGIRGDYEASLLPTALGDYTFHLTGTIHGTTVDFTETSSDQTFNSVRSTSDIQFPVQVPTIDAVVTRLDRIDARIATLGTASGPTQAAVDAAAASATSAQQAADRALLVGGGIGLVGIVVGGLGLIFALRAARIRRTAAG